MNKTGKYLSFFAMAVIMLICCAFSAFADKDADGVEVAYDSNVTGWVRVEVKVPEGFDKIVFFEVMDANGAPSAYQVLPENNYVFEQQLVAGPYRVNAYVHNDNMLDYTVTKSVDTITVTEGKDALVVLTVSGGPEATEDSTAAPVTNPSLADGVPADTETPLNKSDSEEISVEETTADPAASDASSEEQPEEMGVGKRLLIAVTGTAVFVAIVFCSVYIARRCMKLHE